MVALPAMASYHLDCWSGIAGDMFLGACLDLGMPIEVLAEAVARLGLPGVTVESRKSARGGVTGTRFRVLFEGRPLEGPDPDELEDPHAGHHHAETPGHEHPHDHPHPEHHEQPGHGHGHDLASIRRLIGDCALAPAVRTRALRLFERLGEAEAKVHGIPLAHVHFHEVGAIDSIVDLVGAAAAVEHLAPERLTCGPVNVGGGRVRTAHGELPVPAPATADLLAGIPIHGGEGGELTTPTGAVLLAELVDEFVELPALVLEGAGYGLGRRDLAGRPNALRLLRGRGARAGGRETGEVMVVEAEIDDLPGEGFGFLMERLLAAGALDVYFTSVQMKKNRPGTLVTLLCRRPQLESLAGVLL
ncbi:MAG TPA: nickel pincer cofactor biosynthesis protein LarC, partial [Thermoanaerobaculia bacterium]|nr:nickel pincer cofactor biosynthesis protein LarC [Thermoanaerobaculia bacterium]